MPQNDHADQAELDQRHNQLIRNQLRKSVRNLQPMNGSRFIIKDASGQTQTRQPKQGQDHEHHAPAASSENREGSTRSAYTVKQAADLLIRNRNADGSSRIHLK